MSITIRELNPSDFESMTEFYYEFYDEIKENPLFGINLLDEKPSLLDEMNWFLEFQKTCAKGNAIGLIAEINDEMVGFCGVWRRTPRSSGSHRGQVAAHAVKKEHRGKGIGTMLLKEMIERCKGNFEILELEVFVGNQPAKHLYDKFGFKTYGLRPKSVKRNGKYIDEELMYLKL